MTETFGVLLFPETFGQVLFGDRYSNGRGPLKPSLRNALTGNRLEQEGRARLRFEKAPLAINLCSLTFSSAGFKLFRVARQRKFWGCSAWSFELAQEEVASRNV